MTSRSASSEQVSRHYLSPDAGLDGWRELAKVLQVNFDFDAPEPTKFQGSITDFNLGPVRVYEIEATAHVVQRGKSILNQGETPRTLITLHEFGEGSVESHGELHTLLPGDLTILHSKRPFTLSFPGPMRERVISIPAQMLSHEMISSRNLTGISIPCRDGVGKVARDFLDSIFSSIEDFSSKERERLGHSLIEILNTVAGSAFEGVGKELLDTRAYQIERIRIYINENLRDPDLTAQSIAESLGISRRYMNKLFEKEENTIKKLLLAKRLDGAKRDLNDPFKLARSVTEIALYWGFSSPSYFSRVFRAYFGITPREARAKQK